MSWGFRITSPRSLSLHMTLSAHCNAPHCLTTGKTTLLNTLAGKAAGGKVTGRVLINGHRDRLERYRRISGFVPQVPVWFL